MSEFNEALQSVKVLEYLPQVYRPLPNKVVFDNGIISFTPGETTEVREENKSKKFPSFKGLLGFTQQSYNLSQPIPEYPEFEIDYIGSSDGFFTLPPAYLRKKQLIGFDPTHFARSKYGLSHELGHAFINWKKLSLTLLQTAHSERFDNLPHSPEIRNYCRFISLSGELKHLPYPNTEQDLLVLLRQHEVLKKGLTLFEERYAWGIGLALSSLFQGFSDDWLMREGLQAADNALVTYGQNQDEKKFTHGFSKEDSIGNLAYFFEQQFKINLLFLKTKPWVEMEGSEPSSGKN